MRSEKIEDAERWINDNRFMRESAKNSRQAAAEEMSRSRQGCAAYAAGACIVSHHQTAVFDRCNGRRCGIGSVEEKIRARNRAICALAKIGDGQPFVSMVK